MSWGQINTYWIRRFLSRIEELGSNNIANTVCNKHQGAYDTSLREPGHIGADQTQRQRNVDGEHAAQDQARESTSHVVHVQLPDQNHANHRGNGIHNHSGDSRRRNVGGHGGRNKKENDLCSSHRHLHQKGLEFGKSKAVDDDRRELTLSAKETKIRSFRRTYRGYSSIAQVDAKRIQDQAPRLRILEGHPHLLPYERIIVHNTGFVLKRPLHRNGSFSLVEEEGTFRTIRQ